MVKKGICAHRLLYFSGHERLKYDLFRKSIGVRIQRLRAQAGYNIPNAALAMGIESTTYAALEKGSIGKDGESYDLVYLYKVAALYGVSITHLLGDYQSDGTGADIVQKLEALPDSLKDPIKALIQGAQEYAETNKELVVHLDMPTEQLEAGV